MGVTLTDVLLFGKAQSDDVDNATLVIYRRNILRWSSLGGYLDVIVKGVAPLSLPDAIADSLSYVKAFGGTEQRNLPDNYIQRQFIYMMEGSYLLTDIVPTYDGRVEMDFQTTTLPSGSVYLLGGRTETYGGLVFAQGNNSVCIVDAFGTTSNDRYTSNVSLSNNTRYKFTFNNKVATLASGGTTLFTNTFTGENANGGALAINGWNSNGTVSGAQAGIYLYSFKAWNAQGELVADYVPAVQKGTVPVVGFYDTVSKTFKTATAGTFAAGGEAVPTPDAPMDIVSNNGVLKYGVLGKNLFDGQWKVGVYNITSGNYTPNVNNRICNTNIIQVKPSTNYTVSCPSYALAGGMRWLFYDANKNFISANTTGATTITTPSNAKYINFYIANDLTVAIAPDLQLEQGSTATAYEPYRAGIYTDGTVETINVHSRNLFDVNNVTIQANTSIGSDGSLITNASTKVCMTYLPVKPNTTYTISGDVLGGDSGAGSPIYFRLAEYTSSKQFITRGVGVLGSSYTFTTGANTYFARFHCLTRADLNTYQLELGSTATTYVPYYDGGTATAEMLLKVGDYQDVQSIIDGVVTKNIGVKVLDGTEDWIKTGNFPNLYETSVKNDGALSGDIMFALTSTHLVGTTESNANMPDNSIKLTTRGADRTDPLVFIKTLQGNNTLEGFKQWLADQYVAGTPVTIVYPLAQTVTEQVTPQVLNVQTGDNILEITQASLNGLELEAQYQAAVSLTIQEVQDANLDPNVEVTIS